MDINKFKKWLAQNGAEILPETNQWELVRFKGKEVGVLYSSGKVSNLYTENAINCYKKSKKWSGRPLRVGRKKAYTKEKKAILKRDGQACFYCSELLGEDITLEHLIPLVSGGKNTLSNMVLAHEKCNNDLGNSPLVKKVAFAIKKRVEKIANSK